MKDFIVLGSKLTADGDCSHEIKRWLLFGRKAVTNLESVLKSRDIALPTKERKVARLCLTLCDPMDCSLPAPPSMDFPGKSIGVAAISFCIAN